VSDAPDATRPPADPRLAFCKNWLHRAVSAGLSAADFQEVVQPVEHWADWLATWSRRGANYEEAAWTALRAERNASAGMLFRRAALCYHFGCNLHFIDRDRSRQAHRASIRCADAALPLLGLRAERVEIPYESASLPGVLVRPLGDAPAPLVLMINGIDSTKEEFLGRQIEFAERGVASLLFDGPGQGESQYRFPIRGDFEVPAAAALDFAVTRTGVDPTRLGVFGISLGGYYAPRAAAYDRRFRACVSLSGPYDLAEAWPNLGPAHREALRIRSHLATEEQMLEHARTLTLRGAAARIQCPLLVMTGKLDYFAYQQAERLAKEAAGPTTLRVVEDRPHVPDDRDYRYRAEMVDWLCSHLADA
jgi:dienelactone hydrolase